MLALILVEIDVSQTEAAEAGFRNHNFIVYSFSQIFFPVIILDLKEVLGRRDLYFFTPFLVFSFRMFA